MALKIFADYHNQALVRSLQLLFEKRLGHQVYFPTGIEWYDEGYWNIGDVYGDTARNTALQFLAQLPPHDGTGVVEVPNGITFKEFCETKFDVIIASYYPHIDTYERLRKKYQPNAKLVAQYGNNWSFHPDIKNLLSSTSPFQVPNKVRTCWYHQEFDETIFNPGYSHRSQNIISFVHALPVNDLFKKDWEDWQYLEKKNPMWRFLSYGASCRNGCLSEERVAREMKTSQWMLHLKAGGDGYGHSIFKAAACGLPIIFRSSQYKGKMAEKLLVHFETGIDLDRTGLDGDLNLDYSPEMGENIRKKFKEYVDFENEARKVQEFLEDLI